MQVISSLVAGAATLGLAGTAHAVIAFPTQVASGGSISYSGLTDYSAQLGSLSLFNGNFGQLVGVTLNVGYGFSSGITVTAGTNSTGRVATNSAANFATSNSAVSSVFNRVINTIPNTMIGSSTLTPTAFNLIGTTSAFSVVSGTSQTFNSVAQSNLSYSVNSSDFSAFLMNSQSTVFNVYGRTLTGLNLASTGGNASAGQTTVASQSISVLYTFIPAAVTPAVPEPTTWAMMLVGFGMIGASARYRRRTTNVAFT